MRKFLILLFVALAASGAYAQDTTLFSPSAKLQLVSRQFVFTEGASTDKYGNVFFTDQPNNKIWEYDVNGKLTLFLDKAGRSNGMYFDAKGNLITCADENGQLWRINPEKKVTVLVNNLNGKQLNGPNDVWIAPGGGMYITDPYYQRDYWKRTQPDLDGQKLYYLPKNGKHLLLADGDLKQPNGIIGTPNGKHLYVADLGANVTYIYDIGAGGVLSNRRVIIKQASDGMTLDARGNIYLTGKGVTVYNPMGLQIAHINVPEPWTGNLCFGGKNKNILFITASAALYKLNMKVRGVE